MIATTLTRILTHCPCEDGWSKLLSGLGKTAADNDPLPYARIVEINGIDDALWACRAEPQNSKEWRLFAVWCARESLKYSGEWRYVAAVNVAERFAHGMACDDELDAARSAVRADAWDAARSAAWDPAWFAALDAARSSAWAAMRADACDAAWAAAWAAARSSAWAAVRSAAWNAAWTSALDAALDAARNAAWAAQTKKFLEIVG